MSGAAALPVAAIGAVRTPVGRHRGALSGWNAADLLGQTISALITDVGLEPDAIDEVLVGCTAPVGAQAHNIARQSALAAGLPETIPAHTLDDGHRALRTAVATIAAGLAEVILVGGIDMASLLPPNALTHDLPRGPRSQLLAHRYGTWSTRNPVLLAEALAASHNLSRDQLDDYTLDSHTKARAADHRPSITVLRPAPGPLAHDAAALDHDEHLSDDITRGTITSFPPTYQRDGVITRANTAPRADGAATAIVANPTAAERLGLTVAASITASVAAADGTGSLTGHIAATHRALTAAGITAADLAGAQVDETFAATALARQCALQVHPELINPTGGALALGNAPGAAPIAQLAELLAQPLGNEQGHGILVTANPDGTGIATIVQAPQPG